MPAVSILSEKDLRACVGLDHDAVQCIENCFRVLAGGTVVMPPIMRLDIQASNGEVDVKTAYIPGVESFVIKISPGFFDNPALGLPSTNGLMMLFSARTGVLEAALLDNGYLTDVRTAAAGAVAAQWLSREDASSACIVGAGMQAALQLEALTLVRSITSARVWARDSGKAGQFAAQQSQKLGLPVEACESLELAVRGSDIVVTATPSHQPLVHADHLEPGMHVTAVGSDAEHKNELHPGIIASCDQYFCDRLGQVRILGELHHAIATGIVDGQLVFPELGEVIAGDHPGRTSDNDVTVCDLTGTGAQDTAIATLARQRAQARGLGLVFEN